MIRIDFFSVSRVAEAVYQCVCHHENRQQNYHQDEPQGHEVVMYLFFRKMPNHFDSCQLSVVSYQLRGVFANAWAFSSFNKPVFYITSCDLPNFRDAVSCVFLPSTIRWHTPKHRLTVYATVSIQLISEEG